MAAPAAHSILKNGSLPVPSYNPNYSVQSPYSTINVSAENLIKLQIKLKNFWWNFEEKKLTLLCKV